LAGALAGIGAWALETAGRLTPTHASDPNDVVLGAINLPTTTTLLRNNVNHETVIHGYSAMSGVCVLGTSGAGFGVQGTTTGGHAIHATTDSGIGVWGDSRSSHGVFGFSWATDQAAMVGKSEGNGTAIYGYSGTNALHASPGKTGMYGYAGQDSGATGVWGYSPAGRGIVGSTSTGWAGYFNGKIFTNNYLQVGEIPTPPAPPSNNARLFVRDNGAGKTQLCVRFHTGAVKVLATE
jgi:hypothetical protein